MPRLRFGEGGEEDPEETGEGSEETGAIPEISRNTRKDYVLLINSKACRHRRARFLTRNFLKKIDRVK